MSLALGVPHNDHAYRPANQRSRSHSTPSHNTKATDEHSQPTHRPQRPNHGRSHSSLSPTTPKPQKASTDPVEGSSSKHHRIHLPGKHHRDESRKHRYTQSSAEHHQQRIRRQHGESDSLPNLVAGLKREGGKRAGDPENSSATHGGLTKVMSARSNRHLDGGGLGHYSRDEINNLRRQGTNDVKQQPNNQPPKPKNPIEADLERADRIRRQRKFTITKADVTRRDAEIAAAEEELRERLEDVNAKGTSMTRHLDYGYYNLLEKVGNLMGTIQSFQSLAEQSKQLIANFESETGRVEGDMKKKIGNFKRSFEDREDRVDRLETRGKELGSKAEELGRRLENARTMVEAWEKKEDQSKKVWGRFWGGCRWTFVTLTLVVLTIVVAREWWFHGDPVKAGLGVRPGGSHNVSLSLGGREWWPGRKAGEARLAEADIPEDVRSVLHNIQERNRRRKDFFVKPVPVSDRREDSSDSSSDDKRMRVLDEL